MTRLIFFLFFYSFLFTQVTDFTFATIKSSLLNLGPYYHFSINDLGLKKAIYGNGIYSSKRELNLISNVRFKKNVVYINLKNLKFVKTSDILYTLRQYKLYFKKTKNWKYYFFSQINSIRSTKTGIRFQLKKRGLFKLEYFTLPILMEKSIDARSRHNIFVNPLNYRGYGDFYVSSILENSYRLKRITPKLNAINALKFSEYNDFNSLFTDLVQKKIDFYQFHHIEAIARSVRQVFLNYKRRAYEFEKNHLIYLLFNNEQFKNNERIELRKLINITRILEQLLQLRGKVARSIFKKKSNYFYSKSSITYEPFEAIKNLRRIGYKHNEVGGFKRKNMKQIHLFYPKSNVLLMKIANEIALDFSEAQIIVEPIPLTYEEIYSRLPRKKYDIVLLDAFYRDDEYLPLLKKFSAEKIFVNKRINKHIDRLEFIYNKRSYTPILHQIQRFVAREAVLVPLFFAEHYQFLISRNVSNNFLKRVQSKKRIFYGLDHFSKWKFNAK